MPILAGDDVTINRAAGINSAIVILVDEKTKKQKNKNKSATRSTVLADDDTIIQRAAEINSAI